MSLPLGEVELREHERGREPVEEEVVPLDERAAKLAAPPVVWTRPLPPLAPPTRPIGGVLPHARGRLPVVSWVLYDFANTIFSYVVITRYFNEWIVIERGRPDWVVGLMSACVSLALVVALPMLGRAQRSCGAPSAAAAAVHPRRRAGDCRARPRRLGARRPRDGGSGDLRLPGRRGPVPPAAGERGRARAPRAGVGPRHRAGLRGRARGPARRSAPWSARARTSARSLPTAVTVALFALPCLVWVRESRRPAGAAVDRRRPGGLRAPGVRRRRSAASGPPRARRTGASSSRASSTTTPWPPSSPS